MPKVIISLNTHWKVRGVLRNPLAKGNKLFGHTLEGGEEFLETQLPKVIHFLMHTGRWRGVLKSQFPKIINSLDTHWKVERSS